jgi:hypothetical protein
MSEECASPEAESGFFFAHATALTSSENYGLNAAFFIHFL